MIRKPKLRESIYVPSKLYVGHGRDDKIGGLAQIIRIRDDEKETINSIMIEVLEHRGTFYNWQILLERQDELKAKFGNTRAYPDPDYHPSVNDPR